MRIGFITRNYPPNTEGGAEISLSLLANALAKKGVEVLVFVPEDKIKNDQITGDNPKIYRFKWGKKTPFSLENPFAVRSFVSKVINTGEKVDLLDGWNYITPLQPLFQHLKIPYVVSLRDSTPLCDVRQDIHPKALKFNEYFKYRLKYKGLSLKEVMFGIFGYYLTGKRQQIIKNADYVTFASQALKVAYKDINKKSSVIYSIAQPQKNISPGEKNFLYAGRMSSGKGANFLDEIAKDISKSRKDIKFTFVSNINHQEVLNLMQKSFAVIVPSLIFEGFPRAAIESIACGIPVIGTNTGGTPEAIGDAGIVVNPDKKSLIDAIIKLADDRELYLKLKNNTLTQSNKFTEKLISEKVLTIYKEVLK